METTEKGECFLFVNNDVQNVSLKMIPTLIEEHHQKVSYLFIWSKRSFTWKEFKMNLLSVFGN